MKIRYFKYEYGNTTKQVEIWAVREDGMEMLVVIRNISDLNNPFWSEFRANEWYDPRKWGDAPVIENFNDEPIGGWVELTKAEVFAEAL